MHETPYNSSTATTGKDERSKFEKTDTPILVVGSKAAKADSAVDLEQEVDMEVVMEQEVEVSAVEVALVAEELMEEGLEVEVDSKVVLVVGLVVNKAAGMVVLPKKPLLLIPSPTLPPAVVNVVKSSLCEM